MTTNGKITIWNRNFICILIVNCLLVMAHNAVNTMVATYTTFLGAGPKLMGLLTGLFYGVALAMRPVAGPVSTRMDKRKLLMMVYALGSIVNLGFALFHTIPGFTVFRLLNGVQYAFVGSLGITIAADSLPKEKMSSGLGIYGVTAAVATAVAPGIGIWLKDWGSSVRNEDLGFTLVFLFAAALLAACLIPSYLLKSDHKEKEQLEMAGKWYQTIVSKPAILPSIVMMLLMMAYSLFNSYMVPFGEEISAGNMGTFFAVLAMVMLVSRPLCGSLSDRLGHQKVFLPAALLFAAAFLIIGFSNTMAPIIFAAVLAGIGYGAAQPVLQSLVMQTEPKVRSSVASNTLFIGMDIGNFIGPTIGGFIRDAGTFRTVMFFGMVPSLLSAVLLLAGWRSVSHRLEEVRRIDYALKK